MAKTRAGISLVTIWLVLLLLQACGESDTLTLSSTPTGGASVVSVATTAAATTNATTTNAATLPSTTNAATTASATTRSATTSASQPGSAGTKPTPISTGVPRYEAATKCPFKLAKGQTEGPNLQCGYLTVPELHANPNGKTIKLAVATLKGSNSNPKNPPVIFLQGGPGGNSDDIIQVFGTPEFPIRNILQDQDMIIFDQRGVGKSDPALMCSELDDLAHTDLDKITPPAQANAKYLETVLKCRDRLVSQGVNLAAYNSAESASDVDDLRKALGYDKVDLYGVSYGTRLALTVMRDHPQGIRSVILDSTYTPQSSLNVDVPVNANRSFTEFFKACAADAACNRDYPNLQDTFQKLYAQLKAKPAMVKVKDTDQNKTYDVAVDGNLLVSTLFQMLYSTEIIPLLPALITTIQQGKYDLLAYLLPTVLFSDKDVARGMYFSVECTEEVPFEKASDIAANADANNILPEIKEAFVSGGDSEFAICDKWPVNKAGAIENQPVKSDIPTLVLSGQFDPITPPSQGQDAAKTLSKSFYVLFPSYGHGALVSAPAGDCSTKIMRSFLNSPTTKPDSSCTSSLSVNFLPKSSIDLILQRIQQLQNESNP